MTTDPAAPSPRGAREPRRLGPVGLVVAGMAAQQGGAAVAALLFPRVGAIGMVSLRLAIAAVVLLALCRPSPRAVARSAWPVVLGYGAALAGMNTLFYEAIARIPLGAAVTLEVLGPLTLSVLTSRRATRWVWAALALTGVALLGRGGFADLDLPGVLFALGAGALWAGYILAAQRSATDLPGLDGLALAMGVGAVVVLPFGIAAAGTELVAPGVLAVGAAVAVLSSLLPYALEALSLRRLPSSTFAVLMSLAPVAAATAGFLVLGQVPDPLGIVAVGCVVVASAGAVLTSRGPVPTPG